jgi:hypothetical protein
MIAEDGSVNLYEDCSTMTCNIFYSIVTRLQAVQLGFDSWEVQRFFAMPLRLDLVLGPTQPPLQLVLWALSSCVKQPDHEADDLPLCSAVVKNGWSYTSTPPYVFMIWCLIKHRGQLYLPSLLRVCGISSRLQGLPSLC